MATTTTTKTPPTTQIQTIVKKKGRPRKLPHEKAKRKKHTPVPKSDETAKAYAKLGAVIPTCLPRVRGRPTVYEDRFCDMVMEHMGRGYSFESFAAIVGVATDTIYDWTNKISAFSEARKKAQALNLLWWEAQGTSGLWELPQQAKMNNANWIFQMKNRHRWKDRQEIDIETSQKPDALSVELSSKSTMELLDLMEKTKRITQENIIDHA